MISPTFALLQPEAFAAKVARTNPIPDAAAGSAKPFSESLHKHRSSGNEETLTPATENSPEIAPVGAQESDAAAQEPEADVEAHDSVEAPAESPTQSNETPDADVPAPQASAPDADKADSAAQRVTANAATETARQVIAVNDVTTKQTSSPEVATLQPSPEPSSAAQPHAVLPTAPPVGPEPAAQVANSGDLAEAPQVPHAQEAAEIPHKTTVVSETVVAASTPVQPTQRRLEKADASHNVIEAAAASEVDAEAAPNVRIKPVENALPGAEIAHRPADARTFIESLQRIEAASGSTPSPAEPATENKLLAAQVSRGLEAALRQNGGAVTIRLKPETLGALRIELQVHQGSIAAQFEATTNEARELLMKHLGTLRTSLEAKGFGVRSMDVQVAPPAQSGGASHEFGRTLTGEGHARSHDSGAGGNGQTYSRREDPGGFSWDNRSFDPLSEDELIGPGWRSVYIGGSLNAIA